jgi:hypothetical protein
MSTPSSGPDAAAPTGAKATRTALFRWKGIFPIAIVALVILGGSKFYGARLIKAAITDGGTNLLESEVDVADLSIHFFHRP